MNKNIVPFTQLTLGMVFTAAHVVAGKAVTAVFPIFFASGITLLASSSLFLLFILIRTGSLPKVDRRSFLFILIQAFTGIFIFRIGILKGLSYTGAMEGGIILSSTPVLIALLSFFILRESMTARKIIALALCVAGILVLNLLQPAGTGGGNVVLGSLFLAAAVFGEALFTVLRRIIGERVSPVINATYTALFGALFFLPLMIRDIPITRALEFSPGDWILLFFYGTAAPMAAFVLWFSGVSGTSAAVAGIFSAVLPVSTILLSALFLREPLFPYHAIGAVFIIAGIFFVIARPVRKRRKI